MRQSLIAVVLLAGCGGSPDPATPGARVGVPDGARVEAPVTQPPVEQGPWDLQSSGEGTALVLADATGATVLRLFCPVGSGRWLVNAPGFDAIASEQRLSFGHAANVATLIADASGDNARGGVTGEAALPRGLRQLLSSPVSASYGGQSSGPHAAPSPTLVDAFVEACLDSAPPPAGPVPVTPDGTAPESAPPAEKPSTAASVAACRTHGERAIPAIALRAVGTEPFWRARVEGRCVTYSHSGDQAGTRVWTAFSGTGSQGTWSGALRGRPFVMRTRPTPCSDGMSDTRYPITVSLTVGGGQRSGCATPR